MKCTRCCPLVLAEASRASVAFVATIPGAFVKAEDAAVVPPRKESRNHQALQRQGPDGWEGHKELWSVKDGVIVGKNTEPVKVSTYLLTKQKFSDFRLRAKVKLVAVGDALGHRLLGPQSRRSKGDKYTYAGHLVMFPSGWGMYDLYGRNGLPVDGEPAKKVGKQHDWNDLEILAQGNRVRVVRQRHARRRLARSGAGRASRKARSACSCTPTTVPQEVQFKDLVLTTFPEDKLVTVKP